MNSYFLYSIGRTVESMYGSLKFVFVYIIAGIMGNIASFALSQYTSVGASGALMGMLGALLYYGLENPTQFKRYFGYNVIANIVIMVIFGLSNPRIDNYAHFGGLTGGFLASGIAGLGKVQYKYLYRYTAVVLTVAVAAAGLVHGFSK
jgi:rhomboid protease GluP